MTLVVNLFAGPGAGKSTTAAGVFTLLKLHGVNTELVTEYAKERAWDGTLSLVDQTYIFAKQLHRLKRLNGKVDAIVTDSPLLLSLIYGPDDPIFGAMVKREFEQFENMNFFVDRVKPYNPAGRVQCEDEAQGLDDEVWKMLDRFYPHQFVTVPGDHTGINDIAGRVLYQLTDAPRLRVTLNAD